jgi:hypothetical protein
MRIPSTFCPGLLDSPERRLARPILDDGLLVLNPVASTANWPALFSICAASSISPVRIGVIAGLSRAES